MKLGDYILYKLLVGDYRYWDWQHTTCDDGEET